MKTLLPALKTKRLHDLLLMFLWAVVSVSSASKLMVAVVYWVEVPRGTSLFIQQQGISLHLMSIWSFISGLLCLTTPVIAARRLGLGIALYVVSTLSTLFIIAMTFLLFSENPPGSSVALVLFGELYILLLLVVGFTSIFLIWIDNNSFEGK